MKQTAGERGFPDCVESNSVGRAAVLSSITESFLFTTKPTLPSLQFIPADLDISAKLFQSSFKNLPRCRSLHLLRLLLSTVDATVSRWTRQGSVGSR